MVYLDFAKAFDKVDHKILLQKIKALGFTGKLGRWLHSFLVNRYQSVIVNGKKSIKVPVSSGVPQGSVLGPLLFLILIGDINYELKHSFLSSFADDTRLSKGVNSNEDSQLLQDDLNSVFDWASINNVLQRYKI